MICVMTDHWKYVLNIIFNLGLRQGIDWHMLCLQTNEVNQGDSVEHNFSCCVAALAFPVKHGLANMPQVRLFACLFVSFFII